MADRVQVIAVTWWKPAALMPFRTGATLLPVGWLQYPKLVAMTGPTLASKIPAAA